MSIPTIFPRATSAAAALFLCAGAANAENSLYGAYDFDGTATVVAKSPELPFGLGSIDLNETFATSGSIKLQRGRLTIQLDAPISRREVIRLDRKIRSPKGKSYRYRKSGKTTFRGNTLDYQVALNLRRTDGKWGGRAKVKTSVTAGELAGSNANIRGEIEQR